MHSSQVICKTITSKARLKKRFAARLMLLVNHNSSAKVSPVTIAPRKASPYRVIWNVYEFKQFNYIDHSERKLFTGLAMAAFIDCRLMVIKAISNAETVASTNTHQPTDTR